MVNTMPVRPSTKAIVLMLLRNARGQLISGESIAHEAQVSRVAVWKAIEALKHSGYPIESIENEGYRLSETWSDDFLYPWEFPGREDRFFYYDSIDSTMHRARQLAQGGSPGGAVIVAGTQTGPVARHGGRWESGTGGLFFTLLERPLCPLSEYQGFIRYAQQCVGKTLEQELGTVIQYDRYPDLYAEQKKIAGIVSELHALDERIEWMSIGIGVHVNDRVQDDLSTSCQNIAGRPLSRKLLLKDFLILWDNQDKDTQYTEGVH
ncbi:MAG: HTH domain-containing protein [Spirochaetota bacterium]